MEPEVNMRVYKVFEHPMGRYEAVKDGWSWPAAFFGIFWSLFKKLWAVSLALFVLGIFLGFINTTPEVALLLQLIIVIVMGYMGNSWRESKLLSNGYKYLGTSMADNGPTAVAKQLENAEK